MHMRAGVGHIGGNLSALDTLLSLFHDVMREDDAFVLSKGHAAGALYVALWSVGELSAADLETFHRDGTRLAAHPAPLAHARIPFATGSLGHGLSLAAGMALARRLQGRPGRVFCLTSDGEWQEGSTWEALVFLTHHRLTNLVVLVDHNRLQGFGSTAEVASMEPLVDRLSGFPVDVVTVDGHDPVAIARAAGQPQERPRVLVLETVKGHGVSFMENQMAWHYLPMDDAQYAQACAELNGP
jgi:transketolase